MKFLRSFLVVAASALLAAEPAAADEQGSAESYLSEHGLPSVTGAEATKLASSLKSAYTSIQTRTEYIALWDAMETALPTSVYRSLQVSGYDNVATTAPPTWYTKLPKDARKEILKEQSAINSVVTEVLDITQTSTGGAMQQTAPVVAGGAAAAGFLGAVAML